MLLKDSQDRYGLISIVFHWGGAVFVLAMLFLGNSIRASGEALSSRDMLQAHLTLGLTAYAAIAARCAWRFWQGHPAPLPRQAAGWAYRLGKLTHYVLLLALLVMLVSGPALLLARGYGFSLFGAEILPTRPGHPALAQGLGLAHVAGATVLGWGVLIHILAAIKHVAIDRDGSLDRILAP